MNFFRKLKLSFLSVVFIILLPITILIASGMAILIYNQSYNNILEGLNKKLLTISSVTSSFIDGDDHLIIAKPNEMNSSAYDSRKNKLYSIGTNKNLYSINLVAGAAIRVKDIDLSAYDINDISINSNNSVLYAITKKHELIKVNLDNPNKEIQFVKEFDFEPHGLTYDSKNEKIYISSFNKLFELKDTEIALLKEFGNNLYSLNIEDNIIYGINRQKDELFNIKLENLSYNNLEVKNFSVDSSSIHMLALNKKQFYAGNKHLIIYDRKESTVSHEDFARLYRDETSKMYQKYIKPMTDIKVALNLTYHYTFNLLYGDEENNAFYIFDVNEGNEYTPIGSYDFMDHEDLLGAEDVMLRDKSYIGKVKLWEKWGLLKVAFAGVKDKNGNVVAIAGTDIDITIIKEKTHEALTHSITIGLIALILSIIASYYIAKKIIKPINEIKASALKIAAGKYDEKVIIKSPIELNNLSNEFNDMSDQLTNKLKNFKTYSFEVKDKKLSKILHKKLHAINHTQSNQILVTENEIYTKPHGIILYHNLHYVWTSNEIYESQLEISQKSSVMSNLLTRLLKENEPLSIFGQIFDLDKFIVINLNEKTVKDLIINSEFKYEDTSNEITVGDMSIQILTKENQNDVN
jgi:methyl-accepting chemotaxis protein